MKPHMTESEAWRWLAALIEGTDGEMMVRDSGEAFDGLCGAVAHLDIVCTDTMWDMLHRINLALGSREYLHTKRNWTDGVRVNWCLEFAEQAAKEGR